MNVAPPADGRGDDGDRDALKRILIAMVWMPIQVTVSLVFATGGIFFLIVFGILFSPLIGLFLLIRWLTGRKTNPDATTASPATTTLPDPALRLPLDSVRRVLRWRRGSPRQE